MSEKLNLSNPEGVNSVDSDERNDYPPFDPDKAQRLKNLESEKKEISKEELKDINKMVEQLENMGANPAIFNNPAFKQMLEDTIISNGLQMSKDTRANFGDKNIQISTTCEKGDSRYHDRGNMNLYVKDDGTITVESAYVDQNPTRLTQDAFKGYNGLRADDGTIPSREIKNHAIVTEYKLTKDGNLYTSEKSTSETQLSPEESRGGEFGIYYAGRSETTRVFDQEGVEQYREDISYEDRELEGKDYLSAHLGGSDSYTGVPKHASFNLHRFPQLLQTDIKRRTSYTRNPDNTMSITDNKDGEMTKIENARINDEHGTNNLVPDNYVI